MKVLTEGHRYELASFEGGEPQVIQFIHKEPGYTFVGADNEQITTLETISDGTTNEELLEVLINRMNYLNGKFPCRENSVAITHLDTALLWLEKRTRDRIKRGVEGQYKS